MVGKIKLCDTGEAAVAAPATAAAAAGATVASAGGRAEAAVQLLQLLLHPTMCIITAQIRAVLNHEALD